MKNNKTLGALGEEYACKYLTHHGYKILERNWTSHPYELDIIAEKDEVVIFVEVKTRNSLFNGFPEQSVSKNKISFIKKAAELYMQTHTVKACRIDVLSILLHKNAPPEFWHIQDVF